MEANNLIRLEHYSLNGEIELSFIELLSESSLIEITMIEDQKYLSEEDLKKIEKLAYLHQELQINLEGIEVIDNLLSQIAELQKKLDEAQKRLNFYESSS